MARRGSLSVECQCSHACSASRSKLWYPHGGCVRIRQSIQEYIVLGFLHYQNRHLESAMFATRKSTKAKDAKGKRRRAADDDERADDANSDSEQPIAPITTDKRKLNTFSVGGKLRQSLPCSNALALLLMHSLRDGAYANDRRAAPSARRTPCRAARSSRRARLCRKSTRATPRTRRRSTRRRTGASRCFQWGYEVLVAGFY